MTEPESHTGDTVRETEGAAGASELALFTAWRRTLGQIVLAFVRAGALIARICRAWLEGWRRAIAYNRDPASAWLDPDDRTRNAAAALGLRGFVFGMLITAVLVYVEKGIWTAAAISVISEVLWASARFMIIALLMRPGSIDRPRLSTVYLAGLLPYLFGVTAGMRLVALALSALLTYRGLAAAGVRTRDVRTSTGWAFGGQVGAVALGWAIRAIVALIAL